MTIHFLSWLNLLILTNFLTFVPSVYQKTPLKIMKNMSLQLQDGEQHPLEGQPPTSCNMWMSMFCLMRTATVMSMPTMELSLTECFVQMLMEEEKIHVREIQEVLLSYKTLICMNLSELYLGDTDVRNPMLQEFMLGLLRFSSGLQNLLWILGALAEGVKMRRNVLELSV